jgi:hypothetical protein
MSCALFDRGSYEESQDRHRNNKPVLRALTGCRAVCDEMCVKPYALFVKTTNIG